MLVENAVVRVDQAKERVARVKVRMAADQARILLSEPATAIRIVIEGDHVLLGHSRCQHLKVKGKQGAAAAGFQNSAATIHAGLGGLRNPNVNPESLRGLALDTVVGLGQPGAVREFDRNKSVGIIALLLVDVVEPLPVDVNLNSAVSRCKVEVEGIFRAAARFGDQVKGDVAAARALERDRTPARIERLGCLRGTIRFDDLPKRIDPQKLRIGSEARLLRVQAGGRQKVKRQHPSGNGGGSDCHGSRHGILSAPLAKRRPLYCVGWQVRGYLGVQSGFGPQAEQRWASLLEWLDFPALAAQNKIL